MEPYSRIVLLALAVTLCAQFMWKGHGTSASTDSVAFLHYSTHSVTVRLSGDVAKAGVYSLPVGSTVGGVMKMTSGIPAPSSFDSSLFSRRLQQGDVVNLVALRCGSAEISIGSMPVRERMLLGIPLHPDKMNADDWDVLPGIGAKLARTIVDDRQINGDFGTLDGVKRVPGVGDKLLRRISVYF